jgi:hypothetical protein
MRTARNRREHQSPLTRRVVRAAGAVTAAGAAILGGANVVSAESPGQTPTAAYVNPLRAVAHLQASRIDMGVDYSGSGPILALGEGRVTMARDHDSGPVSCWGRTCAPAPGGIVVYRLLDGRFAGKYIYAVENITVSVKAGQTVRAGEKIATLHPASPNLEIGWASGHGAETLAVARGHQCTCGDPGGWSSIEGRNFDALLVWLGAPSGYLTTIPPGQHMPRGWPALPAHRPAHLVTGANPAPPHR